MSRLVLQALRLSLPDGSPLLEATDLVLDGRIAALVGANGSGKSTLCRVLAGIDAAAGGQLLAQTAVGLVDPAAIRRHRGSVGEWLGSRIAEPSLPRWLGRLGLDRLDWSRDTDSLSGGESTRLAIATVLASGAGFLLLDEPSAHLDRAGRDWLRGWLRAHRDGALLVSHDRELLSVASRVLELSGRRLHDYSTDFDGFIALRQHEQAAAERAVGAARQEQARVRERAQIAHERAERRAASGRRGRRGGDHGAMYYDFMQGRAEHGAGRRIRSVEQRVDAAQTELRNARERLRTAARFDLRLQGHGPPAGKRLLDARGLRASAGSRVLFESLDIVLHGPVRIGIVGRNGSGKSRLLRLLAGLDRPNAGEIHRSGLPIAWLDQHAALPLPDATVLSNFRVAQSSLHEDALRERLAWFGFGGERVGQAATTLSAGERMRLMLCCQLAGATLPQVLLLDEPDNHLDLESLAIVEHALRQYPGALVVASHSTGFLRAIGIEQTIDLDRST